MRGVLAAFGVLFLTSGMVQAQRAPAPVFQPRDENEADYPDHPGRPETFGFCAACHGFRVVATQGMTRELWDSSLVWMTQRHNMPELDKADRDLILDYLAKAFPPKSAPAGRPGWRNPFAPQ